MSAQITKSCLAQTTNSFNVPWVEKVWCSITLSVKSESIMLPCYWISKYRETEWNKHHKQPFLPQIKSSQNSGSGRELAENASRSPGPIRHTQLLSNLQIWVRNPQYIGSSGKIKKQSEMEERFTPASPRNIRKDQIPDISRTSLTCAVFRKKELMCLALFLQKACPTGSQKAESQWSRLPLVVSSLYMTAIYAAIPGRTTQIPFWSQMSGSIA